MTLQTPAGDPPWSFTHLDSFETCALLYANKYEFKTIPYVETEAMRAGTRAHQQLRLRMESRAKGRGPIALPEELAALEPLCQAIEARGDVRVEVPLAITKALQPIDFFDKTGQVWHRGKIDLVATRGDGATIFDWKTGNSAYEKPFQLELYVVTMMANYPELERVSVANVWLRNAGTTKSLLGTPRHYTRRGDYQRLVADMYSRYDDLARSRKAGIWPAMPGPFCRGCEVLGCSNRKERT